MPVEATMERGQQPPPQTSVASPDTGSSSPPAGGHQALNETIANIGERRRETIEGDDGVLHKGLPTHLHRPLIKLTLPAGMRSPQTTHLQPATT
ncbi:hypothetical protein ABVK25_012240 [Lepraria finkii]|uniref:Uncharacterized protein n=1 Tax=Lepraria finkii TaxID=1340010 RepID=A0ABR4AHW6_9LECA